MTLLIAVLFSASDYPTMKLLPTSNSLAEKGSPNAYKKYLVATFEVRTFRN